MNFEPSSYFFELLRWRSVSKAAKELGISQPALSRHLKSIEDKIGQKIYVYEEKKITLTKAGESFASFLKERQALEESFITSINNTTYKLHGKLKILTTTGSANFWLVDMAADFLQINDGINISICTTDGKLSYDPNFDIVIGPEIARNDIESSFLKSYNIVLFASDKYLENFGAPQSINDLDNHRMIAYSKSLGSPIGDVDWFLKLGTPNGIAREPFMEINSSIGLLKAVQKGAGIVALGREYIDQKRMGLQQVLPQIKPLRVDIYISHLKQKHNNKVIALFKKFLIEQIKKASGQFTSSGFRF